MLVEPEPHMPDMPEVSTANAEVDNTSELEASDVTVVVDVGAADTPPPSNVEAEPNIVDGAVPMVEQSVPLVVVVVVDMPSGLMPGDAISVEPSGICVGPTGAPGPMPSGDVIPSEGVGATWAKAGPHMKTHAEAMTRSRFIFTSCKRTVVDSRGEAIRFMFDDCRGVGFRSSREREAQPAVMRTSRWVTVRPGP
jgi:hypothetical protein